MFKFSGLTFVKKVKKPIRYDYASQWWPLIAINLR